MASLSSSSNHINEGTMLVRLERKIGLLEGTAITVGAIIGSGKRNVLELLYC